MWYIICQYLDCCAKVMERAKLQRLKIDQPQSWLLLEYVPNKILT
jgi:hypothetical protein